jgi:hypothetical protein
MDQGLYILGGIAVLVAVVLAYLIYAIASYRAAVRTARDAAERDDQPDAEAAPFHIPEVRRTEPPRESPARPPLTERGDATPGYSLGDELERLMRVAEEEQPLTPSVQQAPAVPAEPVSDPEPTFEAPPLMPPLSIGKALSSPAPIAEPEPVPAPVPIAEPSPVEHSSVPGYSLVAPVELHFTGDPGRVGVKPGTRSHAEFQRLAAILLSDLHAARDR